MNQKVNWNDNTCKLIHKECHRKRNLGDIKYHTTLNVICSVEIPFTFCLVGHGKKFVFAH